MLTLLFLACAESASTVDGALAFAEVPPCTLLPAGDELDFRDGCAAGVCAGMDYTAFVAGLGEPDDCDASFGDSQRCEWDIGLHAYFDALDDAIDPASVASLLFVDAAFAGADTNGLGMGVSLACYAEVLGPADEVSATYEDGAYHIDELQFPDDGLTVRDDDELDGLSGALTLDDD